MIRSLQGENVVCLALSSETTTRSSSLTGAGDQPEPSIPQFNQSICPLGPLSVVIFATHNVSQNLQRSTNTLRASGTCRANGIALAGIGRPNRGRPPRGRFQVVRRRILRWALLQLDRGHPLVGDVGGVVMLPGMRDVAGMGLHRVTLENGGVVQGRCLNAGGGSEQQGESTKSNRGLHSN